jgi:hypothetical protein
MPELFHLVSNYGLVPALFIILFWWYIKTTDRRIQHYEQELQRHVDWMRTRIDQEGTHLKTLYLEIENLRLELLKKQKGK